jgi:hypothetical protein
MARRAYTLLEVVAATALVGSVLVSSLALLRDAASLSERVDAQNLLNTLCVSKLEEQLNLTAADFAAGSASGSFSSLGYGNVRFQAVRTDAAAAGGIPDRLIAVTVTVWRDDDADAAQGSGELAMTLATKVAKMALYEAEAGS